MRLDPDVRKQVESKLGRPVPEPDEPEFYRLLEELRTTDPELQELLEKSIVFEQVVPPEEEVRREVKKRALIRDLINRLFMRYDELTGEWVPSRPKQILWAVGGAMGAVIFLWGMNNLPSGKAPAAQAKPPAQEVRAGEGPVASTAPVPSPTPSGEALAPQAPGPSQTPGALEATPTNPEAPGSPVALGAVPGTEAVPPPPTPGAVGEVPPPPQTTGTATYQTPTEVAAPPLTAYTRPAPGQEVAQGPTMTAFLRPQAQEGQGQGQGSSLGVPLGAQAAQGPALAAYQASSQGQAQGQVPPMASFVAYKPAQNPTPPSALAPSSPPSGELRYFQEAMPQVFGAGPTAQAQPGQAQAPQASQTPQASQGASPYLPGTRLRGRLAVKLVVPEGEEVPVAVETEDGAVFLGKAKLSPTRRVEVSLDQAVLGGKTFGVKAVVLGQDRAQGLQAQVREEAPSLVADLVRGSLRGLSDYVRARSQQTTITTSPTGTVIQQGQAPPLELFLGAAAADLFAVPQGQKAVVRLAEEAEGVGLEVLVLGL